MWMGGEVSHSVSKIAYLQAGPCEVRPVGNSDMARSAMAGLSVEVPS